MMLKLTLLLAFTALVACDVRFLPGPFRSSRIINGEEAIPNEFPHQVTLLRNGWHMCGGAVIAEEWVVTAAHCVDKMPVANLSVVVGLHDFGHAVDYIYFYIDYYIVHPDYGIGSGGHPNDIALIKLLPWSGVSISDSIIRLASGTEDFANQLCIITGWGIKVDGSQALKLQKATVTVLDNNRCASVYWGSNILDQHICVKGYDTPEGRGSCNGDSGGPLVCGNVLAGVTSWGLSGCHVDGVVTTPSVYARITHFYEWINDQCGNCNL